MATSVRVVSNQHPCPLPPPLKKLKNIFLCQPRGNAQFRVSPGSLGSNPEQTRVAWKQAWGSGCQAPRNPGLSKWGSELPRLPQGHPAVWGSGFTTIPSHFYFALMGLRTSYVLTHLTHKNRTGKPHSNFRYLLFISRTDLKNNTISSEVAASSLSPQ